jgi:hypothetical protein
VILGVAKGVEICGGKIRQLENNLIVRFASFSFADLIYSKFHEQIFLPDLLKTYRFYDIFIFLEKNPIRLRFPLFGQNRYLFTMIFGQIK